VSRQDNSYMNHISQKIYINAISTTSSADAVVSAQRLFTPAAITATALTNSTTDHSEGGVEKDYTDSRLDDNDSVSYNDSDSDEDTDSRYNHFLSGRCACHLLGRFCSVISLDAVRVTSLGGSAL
jgi:hypothetical protein